MPTPGKTFIPLDMQRPHEARNVQHRHGYRERHLFLRGVRRCFPFRRKRQSEDQQHRGRI